MCCLLSLTNSVWCVICKLICWQYFNVVSVWLHTVLQLVICHIMCTASEMTYIVSGGALNSTQSNHIMCNNMNVDINVGSPWKYLKSPLIFISWSWLIGNPVFRFCHLYFLGYWDDTIVFSFSLDRSDRICTESCNVIFTGTYGMPYSSTLFLTELPSLTECREQLAHKFFDYCTTEIFLIHLLPPPHDSLLLSYKIPSYS